ncbi:hypothetical protein [Streptobacillus ratti]|uniref:hypothetical protein n=1 Tax=Streptobacillus ratti TaxID=1720557 RepID=UPI0009FA7CB7|nr:hypothetical protein [Streptobacillus ratti]
MKKLLLSIMLFVGLFSFSAKTNNKKQEIKKISVTDSNKKRNTGIYNTSSSNKVMGPRYRVELSLGAMDKHGYGLKFVSGAISFLPEWKIEASKNIDITFGPKITTILGSKINGSSGNGDTLFIPGIILGGEVNLNYRIKENVKVYAGLEMGKGVIFEVKAKEWKYEKHVLKSLGKLSLGVKLKDSYNIAVYTGSTKGVVGIESGYTF